MYPCLNKGLQRWATLAKASDLLTVLDLPALLDRRGRVGVHAVYQLEHNHPEKKQESVRV